MLYHGYVPKRFWVEAFGKAVWLINRLPSWVLNMTSPFEMLYKKQPDYSSLWVLAPDASLVCMIMLKQSLTQDLYPMCLWDTMTNTKVTDVFIYQQEGSIFLAMWCLTMGFSL